MEEAFAGDKVGAKASEMDGCLAKLVPQTGIATFLYKLKKMKSDKIRIIRSKRKRHQRHLLHHVCSR